MRRRGGCGGEASGHDARPSLHTHDVRAATREVPSRTGGGALISRRRWFRGTERCRRCAGALSRKPHRERPVMRRRKIHSSTRDRCIAACDALAWVPTARARPFLLARAPSDAHARRGRYESGRHEQPAPPQRPRRTTGRRGARRAGNARNGAWQNDTWGAAGGQLGAIDTRTNQPTVVFIPGFVVFPVRVRRGTLTATHRSYDRR